MSNDSEFEKHRTAILDAKASLYAYGHKLKNTPDRLEGYQLLAESENLTPVIKYMRECELEIIELRRKLSYARA